MFFCGRVQAGRAVESVTIAQRKRRKVEPRGGAGEVLGIGGATQKAEGAAGMEFDVGHGEQQRGEVFALKKFGSVKPLPTPFIAAFDFPDGPMA